MARRRFRGLVKFPGLGLVPKIPSSVKPTDVAVGVAAGAVGGIILNKVAPQLTMLPAFVTSNMDVAGGLATAGILYFAQKKSNPSRAAGHMVGVLLGTAAVWIQQQVTSPTGIFAMSGLVKFPGLNGVLMSNPRMAGYGGPIFANPNTNLNMGRLARMQGLGDDNEDGNFPAP